MEEYENQLKQDLETKKESVDKEKLDLKKKEEEGAKELEDIKKSVELKKEDIIQYIIDNIMNFKLEFPQMVRKRFVEKKKAKKWFCSV